MAAPTPVFIAQKYSSETFYSMHFHSHKKKFDAQLKNLIFLTCNCWSQGVPVLYCTGVYNPQITIQILTVVHTLSHIKQDLVTINKQQQYRQSTYNVRVGRVRAAIVVVEKQAATLTEVFPCFFLSCKANARVNLAKTGHGPHSPKLLCCSMYCLFCAVLCTVCV